MKPKSAKGEIPQISTSGASRSVPDEKGDRQTDQPPHVPRADITERLERLARNGRDRSGAESHKISTTAKFQPSTCMGPTASNRSEAGSSIQTVEAQDGTGPVEAHPLAVLFPMLGDDEIAALAENIKLHGLAEPIVRFQGKILDGRQRLAACKIAGITSTFTDFDGDEAAAVQFVLAKNIHRRNLTKSQRAAIAADLLVHFENQATERRRLLSGTRRNPDGTGSNEEVPERIPGPKGEAREHVAKVLDVNRHYVSDAKAVKERNPELHERVRSGKITLAKAKRNISARTNVRPSGAGSPEPARIIAEGTSRKSGPATQPDRAKEGAEICLVSQAKKAISRVDFLLKNWSLNNLTTIPDILAASKDLRALLADLEQALLIRADSHPNADAA